MDIVSVWLIDIFPPFLQDYGIHCYISHTLSVTQYLFIPFLVSRFVIVALSVYRTSHVCGNAGTVAALYWSWSQQSISAR
jgi:hypothetical protein